MRSSVAWSWVGVLACSGLVGCEGRHSHGGRGASFPAEAVATVAVAAAAGIVGAMNQSQSSTADPSLDLPDYLQPPPAPPPLGATDTEHLAFDPVPVLEAIDRLDLAPCTAYGALIGWGRARLTFEPSGAVSNVVLESSAGLPGTAIECIRRELSAVSASRFEGAPITISASYFVR